MPRGGRRQGAGRPPGAKNRKTIAREQDLAARALIFQSAGGFERISNPTIKPPESQIPPDDSGRKPPDDVPQPWDPRKQAHVVRGYFSPPPQQPVTADTSPAPQDATATAAPVWCAWCGYVPPLTSAPTPYCPACGATGRRREERHRPPPGTPAGGWMGT